MPNNPFNPIAAKARLRVNATLGLLYMTVRWEGGVSGHVVVDGDSQYVMKSPGELATFLHGNITLPAAEAASLGRMCYFMCIRESWTRHDGSVLQSANRYLDSYDPAHFPKQAQWAIEQFTEQLFTVRTEPGHILLDHAFSKL